MFNVAIKQMKFAGKYADKGSANGQDKRKAGMEKADSKPAPKGKAVGQARKADTGSARSARGTEMSAAARARVQDKRQADRQTKAQAKKK